MVEHSKKNLTGHPSRILEESSSENKAEYRSPAQEASGGSKHFNSNWARVHSCNILPKNLAIF